MTGSIIDISRRAILTGAASSLTIASMPKFAFAQNASPLRLVAMPSDIKLVDDQPPFTKVWSFGGTVPGPVLRYRQGEQLKVRVENQLSQDTSVHWHGVRLPNNMDGVPNLTQKPIIPKGEFDYTFNLPDAGTYWYHPHIHSAEQLGRGLYGALIVDEREPIKVDRDIVWMLDDWRLKRDRQVSLDFENFHDMSHAGRIGNTITINGRIPDTFYVRSGERIRLRLINAANARIFGLRFGEMKPTIIALDGHPVSPHRSQSDLIVLGPGMRVDLIIDFADKPGSRFSIEDRYYPRSPYKLIDLVYDESPLRDHVPDWSMELPPNPLAEPDLANAVRHDIVFQGGMMGMMVERQMGVTQGAGSGMGSMMGMMHSGKIWQINGISAQGPMTKPLLTLDRGKTYVLAMTNMTAFPHPIHLHGHTFRVISRNGMPTQYREWQDTVLMETRDRVEIAFVADNPGNWMFHCHILEHQAAGMMGVLRVQ